jgi:hypothetical protein
MPHTARVKQLYTVLNVCATAQAKLAKATGHAVQIYNDLHYLQTFRNVSSSTDLDAGILA